MDRPIGFLIFCPARIVGISGTPKGGHDLIAVGKWLKWTEDDWR